MSGDVMQHTDPALNISPVIAATLDEETQKRRRIASLPMARQGDMRFWDAVCGGCVALRNGNLWAAARRLDMLREEALLIVMSRRADQALLAHINERWRSAGDAQQLALAYQRLVADCQMILTQVGIPYQLTAADEALIPSCLVPIASHGLMPSHEILTQHSISLVLPAYNEEEVIAETVENCLNAACRFCPNVEVIVVDDGSRDRTGAIIDELAALDASVVAIHHSPNRGYGGALLSGFGAAQSDLVFFMDSDGQFNIEDIARLLPIADRQFGTVVLGYREHRQDSFQRRLNAWGWKQMVRLVLGLRGIRDIDCAFKVFPTRLVHGCNVTAQGAMVNTELLVKLQQMQVPIEQVPVRHFPRLHGKATGADLRVILRAFKELGATRRRIRHWQPPK